MASTKKKTTAEIQEEAGRTGASIGGRVIHTDYDTNLILPAIAFAAFGMPAPQGSKKHVGNGRLVEVSTLLPAWKKAVRAEAHSAVLSREDWKGAINEPVLIQAVFTFPHSAASLKRGDVYYTNMPDLDKLQRAIGDAISPEPVKPKQVAGLAPKAKEVERARLKEVAREFAVLADDSCIVAWHSKKVYTNTTSDSLKFPGVAIEVWRMSDLNRATTALGEDFE